MCFFSDFINLGHTLSVNGKRRTPFYRSPVFWRCHHAWQLLLYKFNIFPVLKNFVTEELPSASSALCRSHWEVCSNPIPTNMGALALVVCLGFSVNCILSPWLSESPDFIRVYTLAFRWTGSISMNAIFLGWDPRPYHSSGSTPY